MDKAQFTHAMSYQAPTPEQVAVMKDSTDALTAVGILLCDHVVPSAERTIALRALWEARMKVNAAIALYGVKRPQTGAGDPKDVDR